MKDIVQNLFNLMVQSFDHQGNPTHDAMKREMYAHLMAIPVLWHC
jgi:mediator of RNA polymerase II transcription subunit 10